MASGYTSRFGRSLRDYERAAELHSITALTGELEKTLKIARKLVKESLKMRRPNFTLDQLIEQEDLFHQVKLMRHVCWQSIAVATRNGSTSEHLKVDQAVFTGVWMACRNITDEETQAGSRELLSLHILVQQQMMEGEQQIRLVLFWQPHSLESR